MTLRDSAYSKLADKNLSSQKIETETDADVKELIRNKKVISVIIPLFNEENTIQKVIEQIPNHQTYEIIIVDDGSSDSSIERIRKTKRKGIRIITHSKNRGYGAAILTGFKYATGDIVVTLDSDGQHDPKEIPKLLYPIRNKKADIVIGSRYKGDCLYDLPLYTRTGERFIKVMLRLLFGVRVGNNQSGFRAFNRKALKIFDNMKYEKMGLSTEILFKSGFHNLNILEVPIKVYPRRFGRSYVNLLNIVRAVFGCIVSYSIKKMLKKLYKRVFKDAFEYIWKISDEEILSQHLSSLLSRKKHLEAESSSFVQIFNINR